MQHHSLPWTRLVTVALGAIALASIGAPAVGTDSQVLPGACTDGEGVTVVVDFTDIGGEIEVGCATDATTGTAALTSAGFTDTRDATGMICAIDSLPDPCPATFTGSYWSYWYADGGAWQAWMEGSDTAVPIDGGAEGWRYNDGSAGPGVDPAALADDAGPAEPDAIPVAITPEVARANPWVVGLVGVAVVAAALVVGVRLLRGRPSDHGPYGQD
jgi:hypothetical protein